MSFSSDLKKELIQRNESAIHCRMAFLAGYFSVNGRFVKNDGEPPHISVRADSEDTAGLISRMSCSILERRFDTSPHFIESKNGYRIIISDPEALELLTERLKLINRDGYIEISGIVTERACCKRAFLKGAFLAGGSVSSPERAYQLEIANTTEGNLESLIGIMRDLHLDAKSVRRKSRFVAYMKDGDMISEFLGTIGGMNAVLQFENIRILKGIRNSINREVNCDTANITKSVNAAAKQIEDIKLIEERCGLSGLPETLQIMAHLRLENPHASLTELGALMSPPLGKSGVKHRLSRIEEIADRLQTSR